MHDDLKRRLRDEVEAEFGPRPPQDLTDVLARGRSKRLALRLTITMSMLLLGTAVVAGGLWVGRTWTDAAPLPPADETRREILRVNGEVLRFTGIPREAPGDLIALNPETGEKRILVEDLDLVYSARWSADGRWVAYEASANGTEPAQEGIGLWVVGASLDPRQVATGESAYVWSSTGAELATIRPTSSLNTDRAGSTLSIIDPVTGETSDVASIPEAVDDLTGAGIDVGAHPLAPAWSPDGTRLVFGARGGALYSVDVRSGARSLLVRLPGDDLDTVNQIAWSPGGAHIAVLSGTKPSGSGLYRLYVMDANGSNVRVLVDEFSSLGVDWSPDGTLLAYEDGSEPDGKLRIWVAPTDGSPPAEIWSPPAFSCEPELLCGSKLAWSPDGSRIALQTYGSGSVVSSAIDAEGSGDAESIDELTYISWDGGWYSCACKFW
jgi:dipeptidyl aminopeptidase/acylaminoacyl peptidase